MAKTEVASLPLLPGIYIFKDKAGTILYIGKAKSIRKRVASYFAKQYDDWKISALLEEYGNIEYIVTHTEHEALLLEAQLVKAHQPKYNTLLKSGNPFVYLLFTQDPPTFQLVRNKKIKGTYFGPFIHKNQARKTYEYLERTFRLYRCNKTLENGCLDFHLERCAGSCTTQFDAQGYLDRLQLAQQALEGKRDLFLQTIKDRVQNYSRAREFEKAGQINAYIEHVDAIFTTLAAKFTEKKYAPEIAHATTPSLYKNLTPEIRLQALDELQELLQLPTKPRTIDCFDISHFQSTYLVGSSIRFTDGQPDPKNFRRFFIRSLVEQNDYAALQEIVQRRYAKKHDFPDIMIIDGGKGQLSAVVAIMQAMGVSGPTIISLAKREETLYGPPFPDGLKVAISTPWGQLIIALRDYAHHFAISYHKLLRNKQFTKEPNVKEAYERKKRTTT